MSFLKNTIIIILIIVAIAYFVPDTYDTGKAWVLDKLPFLEKFTEPKELTPDDTISFDYVTDDLGKNYGLILDKFHCTGKDDCTDYFGVDDMECHSTGICYIPIEDGGY